MTSTLPSVDQDIASAVPWVSAGVLEFLDRTIIPMLENPSRYDGICIARPTKFALFGRDVEKNASSILKHVQDKVPGAKIYDIDQIPVEVPAAPSLIIVHNGDQITVTREDVARMTAFQTAPGKALIMVLFQRLPHEMERTPELSNFVAAFDLKHYAPVASKDQRRRFFQYLIEKICVPHIQTFRPELKVALTEDDYHNLAERSAYCDYVTIHRWIACEALFDLGNNETKCDVLDMAFLTERLHRSVRGESNPDSVSASQHDDYVRENMFSEYGGNGSLEEFGNGASKKARVA